MSSALTRIAGAAGGSSGSGSQKDAVPPSDHTQRGCSAPLLRYRHYDDDQKPHLDRVVGTHQGGPARTDQRPKKTGRAGRRQHYFAADLRFPHEEDFFFFYLGVNLIHVNMSSSGKDANYVGPYRLEKTLGKGQTG